jgi:hypothetical protein
LNELGLEFHSSKVVPFFAKVVPKAGFIMWYTIGPMLTMEGTTFKQTEIPAYVIRWWLLVIWLSCLEMWIEFLVNHSSKVITANKWTIIIYLYSSRGCEFFLFPAGRAGHEAECRSDFYFFLYLCLVELSNFGTSNVQYKE